MLEGDGLGAANPILTAMIECYAEVNEKMEPHLSTKMQWKHAGSTGVTMLIENRKVLFFPLA